MDENLAYLRAKAQEELRQLDEQSRRQLWLRRESFFEFIRDVLRRLGVVVDQLESVILRIADDFEPFL